MLIDTHEKVATLALTQSNKWRQWTNCFDGISYNSVHLATCLWNQPHVGIEMRHVDETSNEFENKSWKSLHLIQSNVLQACSRTGPQSKTYRKWLWVVANHLATILSKMVAGKGSRLKKNQAFVQYPPSGYEESVLDSVVSFLGWLCFGGDYL